MNIFEKIIKSQALGDSLLLPYEKLQKNKSHKRYHKYGLKQSFVLNYGVISDDTEHLFLTTKALIETHDITAFRNNLKHSLIKWFWTMPPGIGLTTLKACVKMSCGIKNCGIYSAGNGPLMRVPIIAAYWAHDKPMRDLYINNSTTLTHTDEKAVLSCLVLGDLISFMIINQRKPDIKELNVILEKVINYPEFKVVVDNLNQNVNTVTNFLNCSHGVSAYILHTLPYSVYVIMKSESLEHAAQLIIQASGDTDTLGAICFSSLSVLPFVKAIHLIEFSNILDVPYTINQKNLLLSAILLTFKKNNPLSDKNQNPFKLSWVMSGLRNMIVLCAVMLHAIRRFFWY